MMSAMLSTLLHYPVHHHQIIHLKNKKIPIPHRILPTLVWLLQAIKGNLTQKLIYASLNSPNVSLVASGNQR